MIKQKYIVGDLRGQHNLLEKMLDKIQPSEDSNVIFLGSYVGPGPNSKTTVERLVSLKEKMPNTFYFLKGCYDLLFCEYLGSTSDWENQKLWKTMKGDDAVMSYVSTNGGVRVRLPNGGISRLSLPIPERHIRFLEELPTLYGDTDPPIIVSHTGVAAAFPGTCTKQAAYFGFVPDIENMKQLQIPGKTSIFGHIPFKEPFTDVPGLIGIDLGAGFGGKLCAYNYVADQFHIVE